MDTVFTVVIDGLELDLHEQLDWASAIHQALAGFKGSENLVIYNGNGTKLN
jgi:hypothetical protein